MRCWQVSSTMFPSLGYPAVCSCYFVYFFYIVVVCADSFFLLLNFHYHNTDSPTRIQKNLLPIFTAFLIYALFRLFCVVLLHIQTFSNPSFRRHPLTYNDRRHTAINNLLCCVQCCKHVIMQSHTHFKIKQICSHTHNEAREHIYSHPRIKKNAKYV